MLNRVLIAEQNPSPFATGALPFMDAYYDIRHAFNASSGQLEINGYSGKLPLTIQNMPEQQTGAVYGEGDGSLSLISYAQEKVERGDRRFRAVSPAAPKGYRTTESSSAATWATSMRPTQRRM